MPEGDFVTYWSLRPTEKSIRETSQRVAKSINDIIGQQGLEAAIKRTDAFAGKGLSGKVSRDDKNINAAMAELAQGEKKRTGLTESIAKGVFGANVALTTISFILSSLDPLLKPVLLLLRILVLLIFLPLMPIIKEGMLAFRDALPFFIGISMTLKSILDALAPIIGLPGRLMAIVLGSIFDPASIIDKLKAYFAELIGKLAPMKNFVIDLANFRLNLKTNLDGLIRNLAVGVWSSLKKIVEEIPKIIGGGISFAQYLWNQLQSAVGNLYLSIVAVGETFVIELGRGLSSLIEGIKTVIANLIPEPIRKGLRNLGQSFGFNDFVMRPGQAPIAFSPNDTIIGVKNPGGGNFGGGSTNYSPTYYIDAGIDTSILKRVLAEHDADFLSRLRMNGTFGGRTYNT